MVQNEKWTLELMAKAYLQRMSVIWSSPSSDVKRVAASNQFALPLLTHLMWTQDWPITKPRLIDRVEVNTTQFHNCNVPFKRQERVWLTISCTGL